MRVARQSQLPSLGPMPCDLICGYEPPCGRLADVQPGLWFSQLFERLGAGRKNSGDVRHCETAWTTLRAMPPGGLRVCVRYSLGWLRGLSFSAATQADD